MSATTIVPPKADSLRCFKPTREQERISDEGLSFLNMTACFWSTILYRELPIKHTYDVPLAATDSHYIYVNVDEMKELKWTVENVAFVQAHEVLHFLLADLVQSCGWRELGYVIVDSHGTQIPYDHELMGKAMDYRSNAMLIDAKVGTMPEVGLFDPAISAKGEESCIELYHKLWKIEQAQKKSMPGLTVPSKPNGGKPGKGSGFDIHMDVPPQDIKDEAQGTAPVRRAMAIAAAIQAAEAQGMGDLPAGLKRLIGEILEPKVKWQDHLRAAMQRAQGVPGHDWSKLDRRLISRPERIAFARRSKYGCGTLVVGWDTSGSTHGFVDAFFSEMAGMVAELNPAELIVLRCDTRVHDADYLDQPEDLNDFRHKVNADGVNGGGGTRFEPFFDWIKDNHVEPDMLVVLTDTYGSFPTSEPSYPTIWASIVKNKKVPFGTLVEMDLDQ